MENTKWDISEDIALSGESYHLQCCKSRQQNVHSDSTAAQTENSPTLPCQEPPDPAGPALPAAWCWKQMEQILMLMMEQPGEE